MVFGKSHWIKIHQHHFGLVFKGKISIWLKIKSTRTSHTEQVYKPLRITHTFYNLEERKLTIPKRQCNNKEITHDHDEYFQQRWKTKTKKGVEDHAAICFKPHFVWRKEERVEKETK